MRRSIGIAWMFAASLGFLLAWASFADAQNRRVALVIGNSKYSDVPALPNPLNDSADVAAALTRIGFDVTLAQDLGAVQMRRHLQAFEDKTIGAEIAIVYYAGHGIEVGGTNYLIPVDALLKRDIHVDDEGIPLSRVIAAVQPATTLRLLILDACRNNPFIARMRSFGVASRAVGQGLARLETTGSTVVAYAAKDGTTAADGVGRNSPYTKALLETLEEPGLEVGLMLRKIHDKVYAATGGVQEPFVYGALSSEAVYLVPPAPAPAPVVETVAVAPAENSGSQRSGEANLDNTSLAAAFSVAQQIGTVEAWDAFLEYCHGSIYCGLARAARSRVETTQFALAPEPEPEPQLRPALEPAPATESAAAAPTQPAAATDLPAAPPLETMAAVAPDAGVEAPEPLAAAEPTPAPGLEVIAALDVSPDQAAAQEVARSEPEAAPNPQVMAALDLSPAAVAMGETSEPEAAAPSAPIVVDPVGQPAGAPRASVAADALAAEAPQVVAPLDLGAADLSLQPAAPAEPAAPPSQPEQQLALAAPADDLRLQEGQAGSPETTAEMALAYQFGADGRAAQPATALSLYEEAAAAGSTLAMVGLGSLYLEGEGVAQDDAEARRLFEQAALRDQPAAMNNLGAIYEQGRGVEADETKARQWYERAAALGSATAKHNLALMYASGRGVDPDMERAAALMVDAVSARSPVAIRELTENARRFDRAITMRVQAFLIEGGLLSGSADGVLGPKSRTALAAWADSAGGATNLAMLLEMDGGGGGVGELPEEPAAVPSEPAPTPEAAPAPRKPAPVAKSKRQKPAPETAKSKRAKPAPEATTKRKKPAVAKKPRPAQPTPVARAPAAPAAPRRVAPAPAKPAAAPKFHQRPGCSGGSFSGSCGRKG